MRYSLSGENCTQTRSEIDWDIKGGVGLEST